MRSRLLAWLAMLALAVVAAPRAHADGEGWWGILDKGQAVSLADILAEPSRYRDNAVTFPCIYHSRYDYFDPLRTIFNERRYSNFTVWPDGAALWMKQDFENEHPFMYIARDHNQHEALFALPIYSRLEITAKIKATINRKPAFEVLSWRLTGHRFGKPVVEGVMSGDNFARLGQPAQLEMAAGRYRDVLELYPDLPPVYDMQVRRRLGDVLRRLGFAEEAAEVEGGVPIVARGALPRPGDGMPVHDSPSGAPGSGPRGNRPVGFDDPTPSAGSRAKPGNAAVAWGSPDGPPAAREAPPIESPAATAASPASDALGYGSPDGDVLPTPDALPEPLRTERVENGEALPSLPPPPAQRAPRHVVDFDDPAPVQAPANTEAVGGLAPPLVRPAGELGSTPLLGPAPAYATAPPALAPGVAAPIASEETWQPPSGVADTAGPRPAARTQPSRAPIGRRASAPTSGVVLPDSIPPRRNPRLAGVK